MVNFKARAPSKDVKRVPHNYCGCSELLPLSLMDVQIHNLEIPCHIITEHMTMETKTRPLSEQGTAQ